MQKQVLEYTDNEMHEEALKVLRDGYTLHHEQDMDRFQLLEYLRRIGNTDDDKLGYMSFNPKDTPDITRVTPGKNGMFGHSDLHWHSNGTVYHIGEFKEIIVALYCVEECVDTVFSILDVRRAFADLDEEDKAYWRTIEVQLNNQGTGIYGDVVGIADQSMDEYVQMEPHVGEDRMPVVNKHTVSGEEYLHWQPPLIVKAWENGSITDVEKVKDKLRKTLDRSIYQKHFVFKKGDLLVMDQLLTSHRRSPIKNKDRLLWRVALDYTTIFGGQDA